MKPANLFVTQRGHAKVLDFGLAKLVDLTVHSTAATDAPISADGTAVGTVAYMSPEQARGEVVDARSDLFSFGAVLYEMATGRPAFQAATTAVTHDAILNRPPADLTALNSDLPIPLVRPDRSRWRKIGICVSICRRDTPCARGGETCRRIEALTKRMGLPAPSP